MQTEVSSLSIHITSLIAKIDSQEQYSRCNCLLIHGIGEEKNENTDELAVNVINDNLELDIQAVDIERTHRIGNPKKNKNKGRPIIVKFV